MNEKDLNQMFGYKLLDKGNNIYQLIGNKVNFTGSVNQIKNFAVLTLGFELKEIEFGLDSIIANMHDVAEFGIFKSFIYSYDSVDNKLAN